MSWPAGWMTSLTGRSAMKSPGAPSHRREVARELRGLQADQATLWIVQTRSARSIHGPDIHAMGRDTTLL